MRNFFLIQIILLVDLGFVSFAEAKIQGVTIIVKGLSCPFCAYGIEKKLKDVAGVKSINIIMKTGMVTLTSSENQSINIQQIPKAIKDAGFTPATMRITAIGKVKGDEKKGMIFQVHGSKETFRLIDLKDSVRQKLLVFAQKNVMVEVIGTVEKPGVQITAFSVEEAKKVS